MTYIRRPPYKCYMLFKCDFFNGTSAAVVYNFYTETKKYKIEISTEKKQ